MFTRKKGKKDGFNPQCRQCEKQSDRRYAASPGLERL